ncbi:MAG: hypothetical protein ACO4AI_07250, partial [Prochlorothrix sp.]
IAATDPDVRRQVIAAGRQDPFAPSEIPITVTIPEPPPLDPNDPNNGSTNMPGGGSNSAPAGFPAPPVLGPIPDPFSLVDTSLARAVFISGVVQVGQTAQAIVKSPESDSSRYVAAGQTLANGAVLVKRIEVYGSEPVVILEQNGVEVTRFIGEPAEGLAGEEGLLPDGTELPDAPTGGNPAAI